MKSSGCGDYIIPLPTHFARCVEENKRVITAAKTRKEDQDRGASHTDGMGIWGTHMGLERPVKFSDRMLATNSITIQVKLIKKKKQGGWKAKVNKLIILVARVTLYYDQVPNLILRFLAAKKSKKEEV